MNNRQKELGEFYKELRLARGVKQKDVARGNLTASQLSKFEQGQCMLSADRLLQAVEGINMTFAEFGHALNGYKDRPFMIFGHRLSQAFFEKDLLALEALLAELDNDSIHPKLLQVMVKNAIFSLDPSRKIFEEDIELLTTYLYDVEQWTAFELYLFTNTVSVLDVSDIIFLGRALIKRSILYHSLHNNKRMYKFALLNIVSTLLERKELSLIEYFISELRKVLDYEDVFISVMSEFLEQFYKYSVLGTIDLEDLKAYLDALVILKNPELLGILHLKLEQLLTIYDKTTD